MRTSLLLIWLVCLQICHAQQIMVKDLPEMEKANREAMPGDTINLRGGTWNNVAIVLNCNGTKEKPIVFRAETRGGVKITGKSSLQIGGSFIEVMGLHFMKGCAGRSAVISFRSGTNEIANNCRLSDCVIDDFNNANRMDDNNWIVLFGKNNRVDHCNLINKKNMGVVLAVILDDERSRENFHSIDSNYFGKRIPLASNGGEIIRVGLSQHCQFNSNTIIRDNLFEYCDGETEIISIKSGSNIVSGNVFKESQGSVVLRHGDNNTVRDNAFIGNGKTGTGGVRVINKGQTVTGNLFYKCRGSGFRAPLAIMNGIPNSPANRYVQVTEAVITENTFVECSPMSLGEGSDPERTLSPAGVDFARNMFYNTRDTAVYLSWDDISGIRFASNIVSPSVRQRLQTGFTRPAKFLIPSSTEVALREKKLRKAIGARWYAANKEVKTAYSVVKCNSASEVYRQLNSSKPVSIELTGASYHFKEPLVINRPVRFTTKGRSVALGAPAMRSLFVISGRGQLSLDNFSVNGAGVAATHFISSDSSGSSDHFNLWVNSSVFTSLWRERGCRNFFFASRSIIADSIVFVNNTFRDNHVEMFMMNDETTDRGYYNAEKIAWRGNDVTNHDGRLMDIYRGGVDESTLGPLFIFEKNKLSQVHSKKGEPMIRLYGVQQSVIKGNTFAACNGGGVLIRFEDRVRADHKLYANRYDTSGEVITNRYVKRL